MREIRPSGSVRGVRSDPYPYRDHVNPMRSMALFNDAGRSGDFRDGDDASGGCWHGHRRGKSLSPVAPESYQRPPLTPDGYFVCFFRFIRVVVYEQPLSMIARKDGERIAVQADDRCCMS